MTLDEINKEIRQAWYGGKQMICYAVIGMKDVPFYEVVIEKQEDDTYLAIRNRKYFPAKPFIITAKEFLKILNSAK